MICAGARGETALQLERALQLPASPDSRDQAFKTAIATVLSLVTDDRVSRPSEIGNSLWVQDRVTTLRSPRNSSTLSHDAMAGNCVSPISLTPAEAARSINAWVDDKTRHKIRELISPAELNEHDTHGRRERVVSSKGTWQWVFDKKATREVPFFLGDGRKVLRPIDAAAGATIGHVQERRRPGGRPAVPSWKPFDAHHSSRSEGRPRGSRGRSSQFKR